MGLIKPEIGITLEKLDNPVTEMTLKKGAQAYDDTGQKIEGNYTDRYEVSIGATTSGAYDPLFTPGNGKYHITIFSTAMGAYIQCNLDGQNEIYRTLDAWTPTSIRMMIQDQENATDLHTFEASLTDASRVKFYLELNNTLSVISAIITGGGTYKVKPNSIETPYKIMIIKEFI